MELIPYRRGQLAPQAILQLLPVGLRSAASQMAQVLCSTTYWKQCLESKHRISPTWCSVLPVCHEWSTHTK